MAVKKSSKKVDTPMKVANYYGEIPESSPALEVHEKQSLGHRGNGLYLPVRPRPNHIPPAYKPPSKPHCETQNCNFDAKVMRQPPKPKAKKV